MSTTLENIRKDKRLLNVEQERDLIDIIGGRVKRTLYLKVQRIIKNRMYSLADRDYWYRFKVHDNAIAYSAVHESSRFKEIAEIRKDIFSQVPSDY